MLVDDAPPRPDWLAPLEDPRNETILTAAFHVFAERGFGGATMSEIAARARVSKETLYNRFDNKEGLFYALLAWGSRQQPWDLGAVPEVLAHDPVAALRQYASSSLRVMTCAEGVAVHRIATGEAGRLPPEVTRVYDEFTCQQGRVAFRAIAEALIARGLIAGDHDEMGDAYIGLLRGQIHQDVAIGVRPIPTDDEVTDWANKAVTRFLKAFAP